jgi:hypothetical protein
MRVTTTLRVTRATARTVNGRWAYDCDLHTGRVLLTSSDDAQHHTPERPLWLIHTSGTGILTVEDQRAGTYGIERNGRWAYDCDLHTGRVLLTSSDDNLIHVTVEGV